MVPKAGIPLPAWAKEVAQRLWVWTTPPSSGKVLYKIRWVSVSLEGLYLPSTRSPVSRLTTTMSSGFISSYSTPEGLMTIRPFSRSTPDTLPQVKVTIPYLGSSRFASQTSRFSSSNMIRNHS